jgi:hypothetical protein
MTAGDAPATVLRRAAHSRRAPRPAVLRRGSPRDRRRSRAATARGARSSPRPRHAMRASSSWVPTGCPRWRRAGSAAWRRPCCTTPVIPCSPFRRPARDERGDAPAMAAARRPRDASTPLIAGAVVVARLAAIHVGGPRLAGLDDTWRAGSARETSVGSASRSGSSCARSPARRPRRRLRLSRDSPAGSPSFRAPSPMRSSCASARLAGRSAVLCTRCRGRSG